VPPARSSPNPSTLTQTIAGRMVQSERNLL
jgi:hypothetical protein